MTHLRHVISAAAALLLATACGGGADEAFNEASLASKNSLAFIPAAAESKSTTTDSAGGDQRSASAALSKPGGHAGSDLYIVQLRQPPATAYDGGLAGFTRTRPAQGQKINPNDPTVAKYVGHLASRHDSALQAVGGGRKAYSYGYVFNGFAAALTPSQAEAMRTQSEVISVVKNEMLALETASTPSFLGLDAPGGLWGQLGGPVGKNGPNSSGAGEGVVIGIVDSGVWPEHPSFSDRDANGKLVYQQLPGWHGKCTPGEAFSGSDCNQKLIGAQYFNAGFGGNAGIDADLPFEFNSPRDHNGHGTHTASTAGGNNGVKVSGDYSVLGSISGIAPRARIAAYKACWSVPGTAGSCSNVDTVAAIDQAVADGVDVINYSISGSRTNFRDPVEIAFLFAAQAGVFVAASAGNSGPTTATVAHPGPWLTTVAAGTHPRLVEAVLTLGNGATYRGASITGTGAGPAPLIRAVDAALAGANLANAALCFGGGDLDGAGAVLSATPTLDPAKVAGKIVVCDRGASARVDKSRAVSVAGGVGMVLTNVNVNSLDADVHIIPSVHLQVTDRPAVHAYAQTAGATATIGAANVSNGGTAPLTAGFSSRGPLVAGGGDLLKPDLIAPGQSILAAVAPPNNSNRLFDLYSGTSMSSPHVAGLAALLKQKRPTWSPMAIKSALMTSAGDVLDGPNTNPTVIFRQGAGHVRPNSAADPGLVYDSNFGDWLGFLCGTQLPVSFCTDAGVPVLDPSNLNSASIAVGELGGRQTVTRRVTNVSAKALTMTASVAGLGGFDVQVSPSTLTLAPGATAAYTVTFTTTTAAVNVYQGGQLTWTGGGYSVRSPLVIRPVALLAPAQVSSSYSVTFGYNGSFSAMARGLVPAALTPLTVTQDPDQTFDPASSVGTVVVDVTIPEGTTYARFSTFDADVAASTDLDMYVYNPAGVLVAASANGTSGEESSLRDPTAGVYKVFVHGWGVPSGTTPVVLHTWLLGSTAAGNMTVSAPGTATIGATGNVQLSFSGLASGTKYLGSVAYTGATNMPTPTIVRVDAP